MKAEHRKELKTNTLVSALEKVGTGLKEGPSRRTVVVVGIVLLVVLLVVVWKLLSNLADSRNSARWEKLYAATSPDDLDTLIEKNRNTIQGRAAQLQVARQNLREGLSQIYDNRTDATKTLRKAAESFETLAKEFKKTPILVQECLFGAAQAHEAIGELTDARALYEDLAKRFKDSPLGEKAGELAEKLKDKTAEIEDLQKQFKKDSGSQ
jgi:hypothetical protein